MKSGSPSPSVLTPAQTRLLAAVAERIFPATDTPGALETGALDYIAAGLAGDYAALLPDYRRGLRALDAHAREKLGKKFVALAAVDKDAVLADFEAGRARFKQAADFFETVRCHILEGVFCEPRYGGNRGLAGWRLVGFPGQQHGYPDPYIDKRVDLSPVAEDAPGDGDDRG